MHKQGWTGRDGPRPKCHQVGVLGIVSDCVNLLMYGNTRLILAARIKVADTTPLVSIKVSHEDVAGNNIEKVEILP